jgi:hypothetical protein
LTTTSAGVVGNLILGPSQWLGMLRGEAPAWAALLSQVGLLSFTVPLDSWQAPVGMFAHVLLAAWLVLIAVAVRRGWRRADVVLLLPLPYLFVHLIFVVNTYYPRHVIVAVVATALAALTASGHTLAEPQLATPHEAIWPAGQDALRMG